MWTDMCVCRCIYREIYVCVYVYINIEVCVFMYVCIYRSKVEVESIYLNSTYVHVYMCKYVWLLLHAGAS